MARTGRTDPELEAAIEAALEAFAGIGRVRARRMFGGAGLYRDGRMFALVAFGSIWLKADAANAARFEAEDCPQFVFETAEGRRSVMSYRRMPDAALDDPDMAADWARLGLDAAERGAAQAPARARKRKAA